MKVEIEADGHHKLKIILVGESGVGKTNLINIKILKMKKRQLLIVVFLKKTLSLIIFILMYIYWIL